MIDMEAFRRDRLEALLSEDRTVIERYCLKYGVPILKNEMVFWAGIHKARMQLLEGIPLEKRVESALWLKAHGFRAP